MMQFYFNRTSGRHTEQCGIAAIQAVITLVLVVMSFVLGFIVGGQRSDFQSGQVAQEPTSLEEILKRELAQQQGDVEKAKEFKFYKKLKEDAKSKKRSKPLAVKKASKAPVVATSNKPATPVAKKTSPAASTPQSSPQATSPASAKEIYTLQVGSFKTLASANRLLSDLKQRSVDGFISRADIAGKGEWYRVRVGRFGGQEEAARAARDLQSQTGKSSLITKLELK
jgi:cell division septation protein DedD